MDLIVDQMVSYPVAVSLLFVAADSLDVEIEALGLLPFDHGVWGVIIP